MKRLILPFIFVFALFLLAHGKEFWYIYFPQNYYYYIAPERSLPNEDLLTLDPKFSVVKMEPIQGYYHDVFLLKYNREFKTTEDLITEMNEFGYEPLHYTMFVMQTEKKLSTCKSFAYGLYDNVLDLSTDKDNLFLFDFYYSYHLTNQSKDHSGIWMNNILLMRDSIVKKMYSDKETKDNIWLIAIKSYNPVATL